MRADDIANWDSMARYNFTYVPDGVQDTWRDNSAAVLASQPWTGDCDDLTHTVLALCIKGGATLDECYRLVVTVSGGARHMVGAIQDDAGDWWVVGDTFFYAYPAGQMQHVAIEYNRMSEAGPDLQPVWRTGVPWLA